MKRWLALAMAGVLVLALTACGAGDVGSKEYMEKKAAQSQTAAESSKGASSSSQQQITYEDNLSGLQAYMKAKGAVSEAPQTMQAKMIGAKAGVKYTYGYEGKANVMLELYEFDPNALEEKGKETIRSVKQNGKLKIMDVEVPAILSKNEKYLMIYADKETGEAHEKRQDEVKKIFLAFQK